VSIKGRWIIPLSEIPGNMAIHQHILKYTDLKVQIDKFSKFNSNSYKKKLINFNFQKLKESILDGVDQFGLYPFQYAESPTFEDGPYVSSSLTWNPDAHDKISSNPHMATLGSTSLKWNSASIYDEDQNEKLSFRNSYHDTYSFIERTPISNHLYIKEFLDSFDRTLVRSRISTIRAKRVEATKFDFCWHNDELIFLNLRINIPIQTSPNYAIQVIREAKNEVLEIEEFSMEPGFAYVYDSGKNHRPFCKKIDSIDRVHMICGVSPWFDFDKINQCWISNEYYGEIHPFDMFSMGLISPKFMK
jgi:hypothetical protein